LKLTAESHKTSLLAETKNSIFLLTIFGDDKILMHRSVLIIL